MMLLRKFNRSFTVRKLEQFGTPNVAQLSRLEFPRGSVYHYLPTDGVTELGPTQAMPWLANLEKMALVHHHTDLVTQGTIGRMRKVQTTVGRDLLKLHRLNKKLRPMRDYAAIERDERTLLIENYAPLNRVYVYAETLMSWYDRWHNLFLTMVDQIGYDAGKFPRQNYVMFQVPSKLPAIAKLKRAELRRDNASLEAFKDDNILNFLELWTWIGPNRQGSMFSQLDDTQLRRTNVVFCYQDRFINFNLGELNYWRKDRDAGKVDPLKMQRRLYMSLIHLATSAPVQDDAEVADDDVEFLVDAKGIIPTAEQEEADANADIDVAEEEDLDDAIAAFEKQADETMVEDEDFEIVKEASPEVSEAKHTTITIDTGVKRACLRYIEAGQLSSKEYDRLLSLSESYKSIPNPFGEGTLADAMTVSPEELKVEEEVLVDDPTMVDKTVTRTTTRAMTKRYVREVLPKDIIASIVSLQRNGTIVTDYKAENVVNAANGLVYHTLKLTPVQGEPSTVHFTTPLLDDEGYWTANDVRYTLRKQRVDFLLNGPLIAVMRF